MFGMAALRQKRSVGDSVSRSQTAESLSIIRSASFASATWSNFDWTTFAQEKRCGIQRSFKRRQVDQSIRDHGAAPGRLFDRSGGQAGHVVLDEERINDRYRDRAEQGRGHKLPPIEDIAADQFGNGTDRHRTD
jgi:hypothetical protein